MNTAADFILETRRLTKAFGGFVAVNEVDLSVRRNSIHALIGPNGAGKTTCFHLLTKFISPDKGSILYNGVDITSARPHQVAKMGIARSFQISAIFPHMTIRENIRLALQRKLGWDYAFWKSSSELSKLDERAPTLMLAVGLTEMPDMVAASLSYGRKRALEIATTLALEPDLLLLDEPMAGLGREDIERVSALIRTASAGRTILMVEHNVKVVAELCDKITVLRRGTVLAEGDYATIAQNAEVLDAYLGRDHA
jgi:branched-chain amino acid transport system ATP-binding protein